MFSNNKLKIKFCKGSTRIVLLIGQKTVKFPSFRKNNMGRWRNFLEGILANCKEADFGTCGFEQLCPVLFKFPFGLFIVMDRAEPLPEQLWRVLDVKDFMLGGLCPKVTRSIDKHVSLSVDLVEDRQDSFGLIAHRIVAIDYG